MIFRALACDYDGTLASQDRIGPQARAALERAREAGLRLVLVTGRTFFDLTRVCDCLELFDAVVAENGAVLYWPRSQTLRDQAPAPSSRLLAELDRRGIAYQVGRVVVDTARTNEPGVREALEATGVALDLVYNRAFLMLLPHGVSKGTGVRHVIRDLGLSFHDVLGIGDAENDAELFDACGYTACPADAVPALKARADWVFPGANGAGVAQAITGQILNGTLQVADSPRHQLQVGWAVETCEPVKISARGVNVLVHGDPLSGKSWLAGALVERLVASRYAICVLDPEGDYHVLARLPGVTWEEIRTEGALERLLAHVERDPAASVVADLSALPHAKKLRLMEAGLSRIRQLRRRLGRPHWVVLDEAHYSLHGEGIRPEALDLEAKGFCLATYRSSWLRDSVVKAMDVVVLARTADVDELAFLRSAFAGPATAAERAIALLPELPRGEFVVLQPNGKGPSEARAFFPAPRATRHVRHLRKYADSVTSPERRFFFRQPGGRVVGEADSVNSFRQAVAAAEDAVLAHHARRGDFSRWVLDTFSDRELGVQLRKTEARWRRGEVRDLRQAIDRLIALRYGPERVGA
jgi:hydroxymethylpyrimidine pyrophosphatase-like HAD family hydrolase